ncbi:MAG: hypothetical protein PHU59_00045 [Candidatus Omnitrophica bacterium]|nr:hypothetical protein [Candidatus Omnitrophota bacterium]
MQKKRSNGITLIGIILIVWPLLFLLKVFLVSLNLNHFYLVSILPDIQRPVFALQKVLYIICGIGILRLAKWARVWVLCISGFGIIMWVAAIILKTSPTLPNKIIHILAYLVFCWLLTRAKVKEQFK